MKVGIDSYCYHRFFGEVYPQQNPPSHKITVQDFIERAKALGVEGVSLESCFLPHNDSGSLQNIKEILDQCGLDRVYAWGHPDGLEGGTNQEAYREMIGSFEKADRIGAKVMRVVGSSLQYRQPTSWSSTRTPRGSVSRRREDCARLGNQAGNRKSHRLHVE